MKPRNAYSIPAKFKTGAGPHKSKTKDDVWRCRICNEIIDTGDEFCDFCTLSLSKPEDDNITHCGICGARTMWGWVDSSYEVICCNSNCPTNKGER